MVALFAVGASVAGCGGGSEVIVRPPTSSASGPVTPTTAPTTSKPATIINPRVTVTPARHLHDGQVVHVRARGFTPNQSLVTIECVDLGRRTGPGSCNIAGLTPIAVGGSGSGAVDFTVRKGPFGSDQVSCTTRHHCIVSVSQATANPNQTASAPVSFD